MTESQSPTTNSCSPSPNLIPTPVSSCFSGERNFSGVSSISSVSSTSNDSTSTKSSSSTSRRRGYVRPQGAIFAPSAKNRESVMSLGSIAHLQYYFARTGLLDGKGGQLAKKKENGEYDIPRLSLGGRDVVDSPIDEEGQMMWEAAKEDGEEIMLAPTVSTYSHRTQYIPPPPDQTSLKKDLVDALENALQALESCEEIAKDTTEQPTQGFFEIQGLHILDTVTLAIRAARLYYTLHPNSSRLNQIRPDYQLRRDLYRVLEVLKKCGGRNFAGGIREDERLAILVWVSDVGMMIDQEARLEEEERREREEWLWLDESVWTGKEMQREMNFLEFLMNQTSIREREGGPFRSSQLEADRDGFFRSLADGKALIRMHNVAVEKSKKQFGQISRIHEDTSKPYRRAENVRFWIKAAEIRWETKLTLDVMGLVNATADSSIWPSFEALVLRWSCSVRTELASDWRAEEERKMHARAKTIAHMIPKENAVKVEITVPMHQQDA